MCFFSLLKRFLLLILSDKSLCLSKMHNKETIKGQAEKQKRSEILFRSSLSDGLIGHLSCSIILFE